MKPIEIFNLVYTILNLCILAGFFFAYFLQFVYAIARIFGKFPTHKPHDRDRSFAVVIAARNEEDVIGNLIASIDAQDYPKELVTVFVVADNCTDRTAEVARAAGAVVYERQNDKEVGKGYAMDFLFTNIAKDYPGSPFDAYCMLDADNLLCPVFLREMNRSLGDGHRVVTGYRNSKNFGDSWISAANSIWFLHESEFLNDPRTRLGIGCDVKGTGFVFSREILAEQGGSWPFHLLTEDVEFTVTHSARGEKFAFNPDAEFFDEQPVSFAESWRQRTRWCKGGMQVYAHKWRELLAGLRHKKTFLTCWDLMTVIAPAAFLSFFAVLLNVVGIAVNAICGQSILYSLYLCAGLAATLYVLVLLLGALALIASRKRVRVPAWKKILYLLPFPLFLFTYLPIAILSIFKKSEWKPIRHRIKKVENEEGSSEKR